MIRENATSLQGFAWYVSSRPGSESRGIGKQPFDGVDARYRPPCWPIGLADTGARNRGPVPAFLVITPALTFGPPRVGRDWQVEPAELDGSRTEDGHIRLVGMSGAGPCRGPWSNASSRPGPVRRETLDRGPPRRTVGAEPEADGWRGPGSRLGSPSPRGGYGARSW